MWALIQDGTVAEITDIDPAGRFHPSIQWVACADDAKPGWQFDGEQCLPPPPETIADLAEQKRRALDTARDAAFAAGLEYDIAGEPDVVQTRPRDQTNLLGIAIEARELHAEGVTDPVIKFRGLSNVNRMLTPQEAIDLTKAASAHVKAIYQRSWDRKDAIEQALANQDREGIEAIRT